ncbi:hypothetical protein DY000_02009749 [Brassica cretica]|uniref:Uncharacterized protein n=1 Tax=Brassica cretica TaxID=69181 RepID=A0ABQ7C8V0_BRACR|nr:hypothetical protein DY000_02009749 [Brassica cretica]
MTNLENLDLSGCLNLVGLPSSIGNVTNLKKLFLSVALPYSMTAKYLYGCSSLLELPSSIGNMTNLENLDLKGCSSLVELPYSIGNITNLETLDLDGCSSLVELPSSIGNLHNLKQLNLKNCSTLMALPVNINMKSLVKLDLSFCSVLKSFPEISTNISFLGIIGTAIEEIPTSIRSRSRLDTLDMSYSENLRKSHHAFDLITNLHLSDTGIQEISPLVKEMSRLQTLVINGCMDLVSLPQLPDSLEFMHVENCKSLERLDCSFYRTKLSDLRFVNCLKLNQEPVDLIVKTSTEKYAVFPGETVPAYFSYRATGSSVSMKLNGLDARFPTSLRFKACLLLVTNPDDDEPAAWYRSDISYCINGKLRDVGVFPAYTHIWDPLRPRSEHLVVIEFEETVTSPELVFEFRFKKENWEFKECGLRPLESLALSC